MLTTFSQFPEASYVVEDAAMRDKKLGGEVVEGEIEMALVVGRLLDLDLRAIAAEVVQLELGAAGVLRGSIGHPRIWILLE